MIKDELRQICISYSDEIKELLLTPRQLDILRRIEENKGGYAYNAESWYNISIQAASAQLRNLYSKGYLSRESVIDESGGYIYKYTVGVSLRDNLEKRVLN